MQFAAIGALALGALGLAAYKLQFMLIYPSSFPAGSREIVDTPESYSIPYEDVKLRTSDNETIHLYIMAQLSMRATKTVLFLGPNAGNMGDYLPLSKLVYDMGFNVVTLSYRGYGKSTGTPNEKGLKIDAKTTLEYIQQHPQLKGSALVLYGRSLGGAVAIYTAATAPRGMISGMIVENTFLSIPKLVPHILPMLGRLSFVVTEKWESEKLVSLIDPELPCLFMAGGNDELIPPEHFRKLYELCTSTQKQYNLYPRGEHNDTVMQQGYWDDVRAFLS